MPYKGHSDTLVAQVQLFANKDKKLDAKLVEALVSIVEDIKQLFLAGDVFVYNRDSGQIELQRVNQATNEPINKIDPAPLRVPLNFGVGTTKPQENVHILGPDGGYNSRILHESNSDTRALSGILLGKRGRGNSSVPTAVTDPDVLYEIIATGKDTTTTFPLAYVEACAISFLVDGVVAAGIVPGSILFRTRDASGNYLVRLKIQGTGHLNLPELTTPANPPANSVYFYAKDRGGVSGLFYKDDAGVEHDLIDATLSTGWTDDGANVRLTTAADTVSIGTATPATSAKVTVVGNISAGVGTPANTAILHPTANAQTDHLTLQLASATAGNSAFQKFQRSRGTVTSPTTVNAIDFIGTIAFDAEAGAGPLSLIRVIGYCITRAASNDASGNLAFQTRPAGAGATLATRMEIWGNGSVVLGDQAAALATTAVDGFLYIRSCAGAPTGVPTAVTGSVPMVYDTTNLRLYVYAAGAWRIH